MFALPMPRAARWQRRQGVQAVQNHHKRQEMRKQIARRDEREKKNSLAYARGVWRCMEAERMEGRAPPPMLSKWIFKLVCRGSNALSFGQMD